MWQPIACCTFLALSTRQLWHDWLEFQFNFHSLQIEWWWPTEGYLMERNWSLADSSVVDENICRTNSRWMKTIFSRQTTWSCTVVYQPFTSDEGRETRRSISIESWCNCELRDAGIKAIQSVLFESRTSVMVEPFTDDATKAYVESEEFRFESICFCKRAHWDSACAVSRGIESGKYQTSCST